MIDFHAHTTASDGEYTPREIVELAKSKGITTLAITDHDTVDGLEEGVKAGEEYGIEVIPGVELNAHVQKGQMHILGYYIDYNNPEFQKEMELLREDRDNRNAKFVEEFNNIGINMTIEDIKKYAVGQVIGKPHFARYLYENGYVTDIEEAFQKYIKTDRFRQYKRNPLPAEKAIKIIKEANGIVVLAHPVTLRLTDEELIKKIKELKSLGIDGIECYNSIHTPEDIVKLEKIAKELDLLITAGSDFHGPLIKPGVELATGRDNNVKANEEMLQKIKTLKKSK